MNISSNFFSIRSGNGIARQYKNLKSLKNAKITSLCGASGLIFCPLSGFHGTSKEWPFIIAGAAIGLYGVIDSFRSGEEHTKQIKKIEPKYNKILNRAKKIYG